MKKILFCTDLTEHSHSAMDYAIEIARKTHAKIMVVHSYFVPVPLGDASFPPVYENFDQLQEAHRKEVDKICQKIQSDQQAEVIVCESVVTFNNRGAGVLEKAIEKEADLIVMGSRFVPALLRLWGTTSSQVAKEAVQPVLIVPEGICFSEFKNIIYATDLKEELPMVKKLVEFAKIFNSPVHVLHINDSEYEGTDRIRFSIFEDKIRAQTDYPLIEFNSISHMDTAPALIEYVKHKDADLLIMSRHRYTFFKKMVHKSVSDEILYNSEFPVLFLH